jgi:predicted O-methyltransferase YrrM
MPGPIPIVHPDVARYLDALRPPRAGVLARLEAEAAKESWPIVAPATAACLDVLVRLLKPERVLEIGTAIGYSGIVIASALPPWGNLDTIELDPETAARAEKNFAEAGLKSKVTVLRGPAIEVMRTLERRYDLVFIDAAKEEYLAYLVLALALMPKGAGVLVDNLLWGGRVAVGPEDDAFRKTSTEEIQRFNEQFLRHPELRATILPVGDGLGFGVKV